MIPESFPQPGQHILDLTYDQYLEFMEREKSRSLIKDCCPICGYQFDEINNVNMCPHEHISTREELITEDSDFAWVL